MKLKFVKRANMWVVTWFTYGSKGEKAQHMDWFSTEDEAKKFVEDKK